MDTTATRPCSARLWSSVARTSCGAWTTRAAAAAVRAASPLATGARAAPSSPPTAAGWLTWRRARGTRRCASSARREGPRAGSPTWERPPHASPPSRRTGAACCSRATRQRPYRGRLSSGTFRLMAGRLRLSAAGPQTTFRSSLAALGGSLGGTAAIRQRRSGSGMRVGAGGSFGSTGRGRKNLCVCRGLGAKAPRARLAAHFGVPTTACISCRTTKGLVRCIRAIWRAGMCSGSLRRRRMRGTMRECLRWMQRGGHRCASCLFGRGCCTRWFRAGPLRPLRLRGTGLERSASRVTFRRRRTLRR
mmetsp:Transcript_23648/g.76901  ORF Transcript_23648/g.76901 Transcript_23648/m.76901 type:complete len:305 (+) Transcript_23648:148-1062(+)